MQICIKPLFCPLDLTSHFALCFMCKYSADSHEDKCSFQQRCSLTMTSLTSSSGKISTCSILKCVIFTWRVRVPHKNVYYYRCPEHRKNYVMSFAFCFDQERDVYHFAYCYPYTYSRLQNYLDNLEMKAHKFLHRELLASTIVSCLIIERVIGPTNLSDDADCEGFVQSRMSRFSQNCCRHVVAHCQ